MPEIKTPPIITVDADGKEYATFGPEHSWSDIVRWIARNRADLETVHDLILDELSKFEQERSRWIQ